MKFNTEMNNVMTFQITATTSTLMYYNVRTPFGPWVEFFHSNAMSFAEVPDFVDYITSIDYVNQKIDVGFKDLNDNIAAVYKQAAEDFSKNKSCQTKFITQLTDFTDKVSLNTTNAVNFLINAMSLDSNSERLLMRKTYSDFHASITECAYKPLANCTVCMLSLVRDFK